MPPEEKPGPARSPASPASHAFGRRLRLRSQRQFLEVYRDGRSHHAGPLVVYARPNSLDHPRLGLSVPRRAGGAVRRNLVKRRLREAFRLMQHDLPVGYDIVINVRAHEPLILAEYQRLLARAATKLHRSWVESPPPPPESEPEPEPES